MQFGLWQGLWQGLWHSAHSLAAAAPGFGQNSTLASVQFRVWPEQGAVLKSWP